MGNMTSIFFIFLFLFILPLATMRGEQLMGARKQGKDKIAKVCFGRGEKVRSMQGRREG